MLGGDIAAMLALLFRKGEADIPVQTLNQFLKRKGEAEVPVQTLNQFLGSTDEAEEDIKKGYRRDPWRKC